MKKYFIIILLILFILLFAFLFSKNIILFKSGKIDNLSYIITDRQFERRSKIIDLSENELDISEIYNTILLDNYVYISIRNSFNDENYIDSFISYVTTSAFNESISATTSISGSVYKIRSVSEDAAVAIKFENNDEYYVYFNSVCPSKTFDELLERYNLKTYLSLKVIKYAKKSSIGNFFFQNINLNFTNLMNNEIFESIMKNTNSISDFNYNNLASLNQYFTFSTNSPVYGSRFSIRLTKNDELIISVPGAGNYFICNLDDNTFNSLVTSLKDYTANASIYSVLYY